MRERLHRQTAWYGQSDHPAELVSCPTCYAGAGAGCTLTVSVIGCSIGPVGTPITGLHAERIAVALERFPVVSNELRQTVNQRHAS